MQKVHLTLWLPTSVLWVVIQFKMLQLPAALHEPSSRAYYLYTTTDSAVFYFGTRFKSVHAPYIKIYGTLSLHTQSVQLAGRSDKGERKA